MKKIFTLVAMACMALGAMAQTTYELKGLTADKINVDANGTKGTYAMDGVEIPSVNYTAGGSTVMEVTINGIPVVLQYKNGSAKSNILKFAANFLQTDGKNVVLVIKGAKAGDVISFDAAAKGGTAAVFAVDANCTADAGNPASVAKDEYKPFKFTVTADGDASIKETGGGYRIASVTVTPAGSSAISNIAADAQNANAPVYNLAGQRVGKDAKGVLIQNGKKFVR